MYQVTLTEQQAQVLCSALEMYARIGMGQLGAVLDHPDYTRPSWARGTIELECKEQHRNPLPLGAYHSISSGEISESNRTAYDVMCVVRKRLLLDRDPPAGRFNVWLQDPIQHSSEPLPKIERTA